MAAWSHIVEVRLVDHSAPQLKIYQHAKRLNQDKWSEVNIKGLIWFLSWVGSLKGNITTMVRQKVKFKSQVEVTNRGQ